MRRRKIAAGRLSDYVAHEFATMMAYEIAKEIKEKMEDVEWDLALANLDVLRHELEDNLFLLPPRVQKQIEKDEKDVLKKWVADGNDPDDFKFVFDITDYVNEEDLFQRQQELAGYDYRKLEQDLESDIEDGVNRAERSFNRTLDYFIQDYIKTCQRVEPLRGSPTITVETSKGPVAVKQDHQMIWNSTKLNNIMDEFISDAEPSFGRSHFGGYSEFLRDYYGFAKIAENEIPDSSIANEFVYYVRDYLEIGLTKELNKTLSRHTSDLFKKAKPQDIFAERTNIPLSEVAQNVKFQLSKKGRVECLVWVENNLTLSITINIPIEITQ